MALGRILLILVVTGAGILGPSTCKVGCRAVGLHFANAKPLSQGGSCLNSYLEPALPKHSLVLVSSHLAKQSRSDFREHSNWPTDEGVCSALWICSAGRSRKEGEQMQLYPCNVCCYMHMLPKAIGRPQAHGKASQPSGYDTS